MAARSSAVAACYVEKPAASHHGPAIVKEKFTLQHQVACMIRVVEAFEEHVFNNKKECNVSTLKEALPLNVKQYLHQKLPSFYDHIVKPPPEVDFFDFTVKHNGDVQPFMYFFSKGVWGVRSTPPSKV